MVDTYLLRYYSTKTTARKDRIPTMQNQGRNRRLYWKQPSAYLCCTAFVAVTLSQYSCDAKEENVCQSYLNKVPQVLIEV